MNKIEFEDLQSLINTREIDWDQFTESTFLITGGTGLIGSMLTKLLLLRNEKYQSNIKIILVVRDVERSISMFSAYPNHESITYLAGSIQLIDLSHIKADYIVHTASPTKSSFFVTNPVDTIDTIVGGTMNVLNHARNMNIKSMLNVSSMESYGTLNSENVTEDMLGELSLESLRSSYPESKRMSELLALAFSSQYQLNVNSLRLAQTFGAGITENENRVFKYFIDCVLDKKDIILRSTGETIINFCYLSDALKAIMILLVNAPGGQTYNASGESYSLTIKEIAQWLIDYHELDTKLVFRVDENDQFAPVNKMKLNSGKLKELGWIPTVDIKDAYIRLKKSLER